MDDGGVRDQSQGRPDDLSGNWLENPRLTLSMLTPGQRYTAVIVVVLAGAVLGFGLPRGVGTSTAMGGYTASGRPTSSLLQPAPTSPAGSNALPGAVSAAAPGAPTAVGVGAPSSPSGLGAGLPENTAVTTFSTVASPSVSGPPATMYTSSTTTTTTTTTTTLPLGVTLPALPVPVPSARVTVPSPPVPLPLLPAGFFGMGVWVP